MNKTYNIRLTCEACGKGELLEYNISQNPITLDKIETYKFKVTNKDYGRAIETVQCSSCKLVQPKYILSFEDIIKFYSDIEDDSYLQSASVRGASNLSQVKKIIEKVKADAKTILEIGAGSGTMVALLKNIYSHVQGVEPNKNFCEYAKKTYNISLICSGYEKLSEDNKYDVILALDVIEHVVSPSDFMNKIYNLLNPGGIAIIGTPDVSSLSAKILKKKWYHIRPMHLFYFTPKSFELISKRNELNIISKKYFSWTLPSEYLLDSLQKLLFKKTLVKLKVPFVKSVKVNFFDSIVYIVKKN